MAALPPLLDRACAGTALLREALPFSEAAVALRTLLQTAELRVILLSFSSGQELPVHSNRRRALVQILEGACDFFYADKWQRLSAGTVLHLPPDHPHGVKAAAGPFSMLLTLGGERAQLSVSP